MNIVSDYSILWLVKNGRHQNKICAVLRYFFVNMDSGPVAHVAIMESSYNETATIMAKDLESINPPGWPLTERAYLEFCREVYGFEKYPQKKGNGINLLRTENIAQPRAIRIGDVLANGLKVEKLRMGFNSSVLIGFDNSVWVELAPRLPIALIGNEKFKLPLQLNENDELATECKVVDVRISSKENWINVYLDRETCCIKIPFCIPLALA